MRIFRRARIYAVGMDSRRFRISQSGNPAIPSKKLLSVFDDVQAPRPQLFQPGQLIFFDADLDVYSIVGVTFV